MSDERWAMSQTGLLAHCPSLIAHRSQRPTAVPMPPYPVLCYARDCGKPAEYKIAARWSDGATAELKTYSLCCADHLAEQFALSRRKQRACRRAPGEVLDPPGIFRH